MDDDIRKITLKYAVKNAYEHGGKAVVGAVTGKVLSERPDLKNKIKDILPLIKEVVDHVNSLPFEEIEKLYRSFDYKEHIKEERKDLPELPGAEGGITVRFAPEPGGYIHLGNLRAAVVNHLYVQKYGGTYILRFDDTNPYNAKSVYYDAIKEDLEALGIRPDKVVYQSDRIDIYVSYLKTLIERGLAYASFDPPEILNEKRKKGVPFSGREKEPEYHLTILDEILEGKYGEGEVAFFLKTDPSHPNPVLRDPGIFRIIDTVPHPRTGWKYNLYPTYNFASAIDDGTLGITHILRGKDHENNGKVQRTVQEYLSLNTPYVLAFGRLKIDESSFSVGLSKRKIREALREGIITGWDDPSTLTVRALLKRGIRPETFIEFFRSIGAKKSDVNVSMENIYSINRKLIDPDTKRIFFVEDPVEVTVDMKKRIHVNIPYHPDNRDLGFREYRIKKHVFYLEKGDIEEGKLLRLKYLYNIRIIKIKNNTAFAEYAGEDVNISPKVHWVYKPFSSYAVVRTTTGSVVNGIIEGYVHDLKVGETVQFDRKYFATLNRNEGEVLEFYYTHR